MAEKDTTNPSHYKSEGPLGLQVVDVMEEFLMDNPHRQNACKYFLRDSADKGVDPIEDMSKCIWWMMREALYWYGEEGLEELKQRIGCEVDA